MELSPNVKLTLILLIFKDCKILDFWPNLEFSKTHLLVFKIMGNRQTNKKI